MSGSVDYEKTVELQGTKHPRTIAILGWAKLSHQAKEGTGYNLSASELATGLAMMGHRVLYLSSGMKYSVVPGMRIRLREYWRDIQCYELVNSPNLSPSAANFRNPNQESNSPKQSAAVVKFLIQNKVDIVHAHSLEGQGLDLVSAIKNAGMLCVLTLHNYWHVCPQVDLIYKEHELCFDYLGGKRCEDCLSEPSPAAQRCKRAVLRIAENMLGPKQTELIKLKLKRTFGKSLGRDAPSLPPAQLTSDANERFVDGTDVHLTVLNDYGKRREAGVDSLNAADLVMPPSEFNMKLHASMGVDKSKLRVVRYGQPHFDQINRKARNSPFYNKAPWDAASATRPLRFGFFGTIRPNKGLEVLVRAIEGLDAEVRKRCQFVIRAHGGDWAFRKRMAKYPEVNFLGGYDLIQLIAASGEYDVGILPHIWFDNSPLVMWEHLHAGKMIIAARLGGAADTIKPIDNDEGEPGNGLFFPGGCPDDLALRITQLITGEIAIPTAKQIHDATTLTSYPEHVTAMDEIYSGLFGISTINN